MSYASIIKEIGRGAEGSRDMTQEDAKYLYGAMLDGGVPISKWARSSLPCA